MSEFERIDQHSAWADAGELRFPEDFSTEEMAFTTQMRDLFAIDSEELPPFFVQTLLDETQYPIPGKGFEQRVIEGTFSRLHLSPSLPPQPDSGRSLHAERAPTLRSSHLTLRGRARTFQLAVRSYFSRPLVVGVSLLMLAIVVVFATPTFAQGLSVFFGNTGVLQISNPPTPSGIPGHKKTHPADPDAITFDPNMPLFWVGSVAHSYVYDGAQLQAPTQWSKGAIVELQYGLSSTSQGSGILDIREFQVASAYSAVLQVVEEGSATSMMLGNGEPAVYVDGTWVQHMFDHTPTYIWQTGTRCMLVMEQQGVVIWMVGDPRDGLTAATMAAIASKLAPVRQATLMRHYRAIEVIGSSLVVSVNNASGSECYLLVPQNISPATGAGQFVYSGSADSTSIAAGPGG
jgi:hypothetical protein